MNRGLVVCVAYWTAFGIQLVALGQNFNMCIKSNGPKVTLKVKLILIWNVNSTCILLTFLLTYLLIYLLPNLLITYLIIYLLNYLLTLLTYLLTYSLTHLLTYLLTF